MNNLEKLAQKIEDKLFMYREICYSEDSNDLFDELHDDLYYQCVGFSETYNELLEDIKEGLDEKHYKAWFKALSKDYAMVLQVEEYYNAVTKVPEINWIYA